jgi:UDP-N-acetylmuramoylalanine--D-glutamate ligase
MDIRGKRITVFGAARSGLAVARLLMDHGALVFLSEKASRDERADAARILDEASIPSEFGGHTSRVFEADWWVVSPGIAESHPMLLKAKKRGIPVVGELEAASWFCEAPIVAVTGSNGKSSTTALVGEMFRYAGRPYLVAGNIGHPFSDAVEAAVPEAVAVLEVSSFQLETVRTFRPRVAVFLNLKPDHLDRHGSMAHYGALKSRIFENQSSSDAVVYNGNDARVAGLVQRTKGRKVAFGVEQAAWCGFVREGELILRLGEGEESLLVSTEMGIPGEHNVANGLAAALAARLMEVPKGAVCNALRRFRGLPHRMETVREFEGVLWVNDSKSTNTDSLWYALGSYERPIVLIAGGRDKDSDFTTLKDRVGQRVRAVVLMGEAAEKMAQVFDAVRPVVRVSSLEEAVEKGRSLAKSGDVVLLSPGCASFDMFRDFEDRGDQFKSLVEKLG